MYEKKLADNWFYVVLDSLSHVAWMNTLTIIISFPLTLLEHNVSEALLTSYDSTATEMQNM